MNEENKTQFQFNTMYTPSKIRYKSNPGSRTRKKFDTIAPFSVDPKTGEVLNDTNLPKRVVVGEVDIYDEIQSYKESCDLRCILKQLALSGQSLPVEPVAVSDVVEDLRELPQTLNEVKQSHDFLKKNETTINEILARYKNPASLPVDDSSGSLTADEVKTLRDLLNKKGGLE